MPQLTPQTESFDGGDYSAFMEGSDSSNESDPAKIMNSSEPTLIFFHAPWCGHCKRAKPEFEKLMKKISGMKGKKAAMINCDEHQDIARDNDVQGFPTIRYYHEGPKSKKFREYAGDRSMESMYQFMN